MTSPWGPSLLPEFMEPVPHLDADPGVARLAQRHEVRLIMRPAMIQRQDVMHFGRLGQPAFLFALFTQRVGSQEPGTFLLPLSAVPSLGHRVTTVSFILAACQLLMFLAVPFISKPGTAGVAAWPFRFPWHPHHLRLYFCATKKPHGIVSHEAHPVFTFPLIIL